MKYNILNTEYTLFPAQFNGAVEVGNLNWQNEQSGQHGSSWMKKHVPFIDLLGQNGYVTGLTGKGVAPFQYARDESDSLWRATNAAGIAHSNIRYEPGSSGNERPASEISNINYFENFKYFMENVREDEPFFFWYGALEPHRGYEKDSWKRSGKNLEDVAVPGFFPDNGIIRGDILDYAIEIEWFDLHLQRMLAYLEETGELENTIVIVTSDQGMPFPRAKANCYEYVIRVPFAVRYPDYSEIEKEMKEALMQELIRSEDPRVVGPDKDIFDSYPRYMHMREFPEADSIIKSLPG